MRPDKEEKRKAKLEHEYSSFKTPDIFDPGL